MLMKKARLIKSSLVLLPILFTLHAIAQDAPQWNLPEGASMRLGKGSLTGPVAYSPDGVRLAVASSLGIWLYNTTDFQESALFNGHTAWIDNMTFSPDGLSLATPSWDGTIRLWDATTGAHKKTLGGNTSPALSLAFSPDGLTLAVGGWSGNLHLWNVVTGEHIRALEGHTMDGPYRRV